MEKLSKKDNKEKHTSLKGLAVGLGASTVPTLASQASVLPLAFGGPEKVTRREARRIAKELNRQIKKRKVKVD